MQHDRSEISRKLGGCVGGCGNKCNPFNAFEVLLDCVICRFTIYHFTTPKVQTGITFQSLPSCITQKKDLLLIPGLSSTAVSLNLGSYCLIDSDSLIQPGSHFYWWQLYAVNALAWSQTGSCLQLLSTSLIWAYVWLSKMLFIMYVNWRSQGLSEKEKLIMPVKM